MNDFATFGQELYFDESVRAIEELADVDLSDRHLSAKVADLLPQPSKGTRFRVASKIVQRFFKAANPKDSGQAFLKLVRRSRSELERRDLLYWRSARADAVIASLAREVFYPYFVLQALPAGYDDAAFRMANHEMLFSVDHVITRDFAIRFARDTWGFRSARTVTLALRIMRQAEILDAVSTKLPRRHALGYYPKPHAIQPEVFAYCLYEEFLDSSPTIPVDRIHDADCVKVFLMNRLQADSMLKSVEKMKLVSFTAEPGGRHIKFAHPDLDSLASALITDH